MNACHFSEISDLISKNMVDSGVMAIENSITGAILPNYNLIDSNNLSINGEIYLPMIHNLVTYPGQLISDIKEVWSHPIALRHCEKFLRKFPLLRIIEDKDTAAVAKKIQEEKLKGVAAIASEKAAKLYELKYT